MSESVARRHSHISRAKGRIYYSSRRSDQNNDLAIAMVDIIESIRSNKAAVKAKIFSTIVI